jgi:hypothetical protein
MATHKSGHRPAGGLHSNKVVHRPHGKTEPVLHAKRPAGVSQYGQMQGTHVTRGGESDYRGERVEGGRGYAAPLGITDPVKAVGVGGGRTVMRTGGQGQHGSAVQGGPPIANTKGQWPDKR